MDLKATDPFVSAGSDTKEATPRTVLLGVLMGLAFLLKQGKSSMLASIGMHLPIQTSFAIFVGGTIRAFLEACTGILFAALAFAGVEMASPFEDPSYLASLVGLTALGAVLVWVPGKAASWEAR